MDIYSNQLVNSSYLFPPPPRMDLRAGDPWLHSNQRWPSVWRHGAYTFLNLLTVTSQVVNRWPFSFLPHLFRRQRSRWYLKTAKSKLPSITYTAEKMIHCQYYFPESERLLSLIYWFSSNKRVHLAAFTFEICWSYFSAPLHKLVKRD